MGMRTIQLEMVFSSRLGDHDHRLMRPSLLRLNENDFFDGLARCALSLRMRDGGRKTTHPEPAEHLLTLDDRGSLPLLSGFNMWSSIAKR